MQDYETQYEKATINFEGVKIAMRQDKNGYILTLSVHPNEVPESLLRDWVGSRYQVAMVQIGDDEMPVVPKNKTEGERYVAKAGLLCKEREFQLFIADRNNIPAFDVIIGVEDFNSDNCAECLRRELGIDSRSELMENKEARQQLDMIILDYGKSQWAK